MQRLTTRSLLKRRVINKGAKRFRRTNFNRAHTGTFNFSKSTSALLLGSFIGTVGYFLVNNDEGHAEQTRVDYNAVRAEIVKLLEDETYDDGSYGPVFIRLAWHASGTYSKAENTGGSNGATMRFAPESDWGANAGLRYARERLESVKRKFPGITYADLWTLAGAVAVEQMGGPKIRWRPGRSDHIDNKLTVPDGRLPDSLKGSDHIREIFYRMGFNDQEIVALVGCHVVGRMHRDRSGHDGPWTNAPTTFSNDFFVQLKERKWTPKKWDGPLQFTDENNQLTMLPADIALLKDPSFRKYVDIYAESEEKFFEDFAKAFEKLLELGVKFSN